MSTTRQELLNTNNPLAGMVAADLASLASNGVVLAASAISNKIGDSAGQGYPFARAKLTIGAPAAAWTGSIYVWFLAADDAANYEFYKTTTPSTVAPLNRAPDAIFTPYPSTDAQIVLCECQPPIVGAMKCLCWNNAGQALAGTNKLDLYMLTDQGN